MSTRHAVRDDLDSRPWTGPTRRYDILKEGAIALAIVAVLTFGLSALFSSPDEPALTFKGWSQSAPDNMYATMVAEMSGSSETAGYGPPYNVNSDGLSIGPLALQKWFGVTHPIDAAQDFVIAPLQSQQQPDAVTAAVSQWTSASADQRTAWATAYEDALNDPAGANGDATKVPAGDYGPVPTLAAAVVAMASSGAYDGALASAGGHFFNTDNTKQTMLMGDGSYMDDLATAGNLQGNTWGMVNETGSWPGQQWLATYSFWYQLPMFNNEDPNNTVATVLTDNADAIIFAIMFVVILLFVFLPFIPGLRSIPRWIPIQRLVWRQYYREYGKR
ncbi:MAG: hypothetical protein WCI29_07100 [Actinomycetes bacterium]|jgi:hypothetical protein